MRADRASATARLIAAATVMRDGAEDGPPAGAGAWCDRFLSTTGADRMLRASVRSRVGRVLWRRLEAMTIRGLVSHWLRRKHEIDRLVRRGAEEGFTQLIVVGAGLDTLAWRHTDSFERVMSADHPATLSVVRDALGGDSQGVGVELLALDLSEADVFETLAGATTFDAALPALIVAEGVLMYLHDSAVERTLADLARLPTPCSRLIASWMLDEGGPLGFRGQSRFVDAWLRRRQEPMRWGATPDSVCLLASRCGWDRPDLVDMTGPSSLTTARGLASERLLVADRR